MEQKFDSVYNVDKYAVGNRIYKLRKDKKMSQMQLAELVGLSNNSISNYETGNQLCGTENLQRLANVLGTSSEFLLYGTKSNKVTSEEQELEIELFKEWKKCSLSEKRKLVAAIKAINMIDFQIS